METIKTDLRESLRRNDLLQAAFLVSKVAELNFDSQKYIDCFAEYVTSIKRRIKDPNKDPIETVRAINQCIFDEMGLSGKTLKYKKVIDDADQFFFHKMFDEKAGAPICYSILFLLLAKEMGLNSECLAFPTKFMIRMEHETSEFYVDPFEGGKILSENEFQHHFQAAMQRNRLLSTKLYEVMGISKLIGRLVQQLKHVYILKNDALRALRCIEMLTVIFPDSPELTRDRGILYCEMEYFSKAKTDLQKYLVARPNADDTKEIRKLTKMLSGYRETMN